MVHEKAVTHDPARPEILRELYIKSAVIVVALIALFVYSIVV